ncbi:MAG: cyclic pyranopterin monophosphate synthase MoaC [Vicinamibacterales bacterium]
MARRSKPHSGVTLSHIGPDGAPRMVDVTAKAATLREAVARGRAFMAPSTRRLVEEGKGPKGDVISVARLAGIMAAKQTSTLIPLCHPLALSAVDVQLRPRRDGFEIEARVRTAGQTGVEMEALTAVAVAALTLYDMVKAADRTVVIGEIRLIAKSGGRSGSWRRPRGV